MHKIEDICKEMRKLDRISGIDTSEIPIRISGRMTRTWGKCRSARRYGKYSVEELVFSARFMKYANDEHFLNTVRHEYAHAFVTLHHNKFDNHGPLWKAAAIRFGCSGDRCTDMPEVDDNIQSQSKYILECPACAWKRSYERAGKVVQTYQKNPNNSRYCCPICRNNNLVLR